MARDGNNVLSRKRLQPEDVAKGQAAVLQDCFGALRSPAKHMARETGLTERACRNQLSGVNCMNLADFFNACQAIPELRSWGAMMMGLVAAGDPGVGKELARSMPTVLLRIEQGGAVSIVPDEKGAGR